MAFLLRAFLIVLSVGFLFYVLLMVRRDRFLLKYSIVWVVIGILGVIAAIFPEGVGWVSSALGFEMPVNFIFLVVILFLMVASLVFVAALSKQSLLVKQLIQEVSLLQATQNETAGTKAPEESAADQGDPEDE